DTRRFGVTLPGPDAPIADRPLAGRCPRLRPQRVRTLSGEQGAPLRHRDRLRQRRRPRLPGLSVQQPLPHRPVQPDARAGPDRSGHRSQPAHPLSCLPALLVQRAGAGAGGGGAITLLWRSLNFLSRRARTSSSPPNTRAWAPTRAGGGSDPGPRRTNSRTPTGRERTPAGPSQNSPVISLRRRIAATISRTPVMIAQAPM